MLVKRSHVTIPVLYVLTDALYDLGLLRLPFPYGDALYYGRYVALLVWYAFKTAKSRLKWRKNLRRLKRR